MEEVRYAWYFHLCTKSSRPLQPDCNVLAQTNDRSKGLPYTSVRSVLAKRACD